MPVKTNLNISPYFDDFDKADNFYKMLFKPGFPVQARELTGLQSILQNQIESFGSHIFKEGSMVIPGGITYDNRYYAAKVNPDHLGIDVTVYLDALKGAFVKGQESQIEAKIDTYVLPPDEGVDEITIFLKYTTSGTESVSKEFPNGETLLVDKNNVTYGNTTFNVGDSVLTLVPVQACHTGSSVGLDKGVYFIRGTFVDVPKTSIVLDPYTDTPSYRVGLDILEEVITSNDDSSLNDNAKGFTNYAAPGADRFKITVRLTKKSLQDFEDTNFVELLRVSNGEIKKLQDTSVYNEIRKYFAKRTFDESGNYSLKPFRINVSNSLNDELGNGGLFTEDQKTEDGNDPSDDTMCVTVSSGKAYVKGFDITLPGSRVIDVAKPRDVKDIKNASIPFEMGCRIAVDNIFGSPYISIGNNTAANRVKLFNQRRDASSTNGTNLGTHIGWARAYSYNFADKNTVDVTNSSWDLYLWDIQTFTNLELSMAPDLDEVPKSSLIRGSRSGATGYFEGSGAGTTTISLYQTSGTFMVGESLIINEKTTYNSTIKSINQFNTEDIKSMWQDCSGAGMQTDFVCDTVLYWKIPPQFSSTDILNVATNGTTTCPGRLFGPNTGIKVGSYLAYMSEHSSSLPTYNRVSAVASDGASCTLVAGSSVNTVAGVAEHRIPAAGSNASQFAVAVPRVHNLQGSALYERLPKGAISAVNLAGANLKVTKQIQGESSDGNGNCTVFSHQALDTASGITSCFFEPWQEDRYAVHYNDGSFENLTSDQVNINADGNRLDITGLVANKSSQIDVKVTVRKLDLKSKSKDYIRSATVDVTRTSGTSTQAGLTTSNFYGLRIEDDEVSLNVPDVVKVHAVYESTGSAAPINDKLTFVSGLSLNTATFVGEKIVGKNSRAIGQVVNRPSATETEFVYLNTKKFELGESVTFKESNITTNIQEITFGDYVNKTNDYKLDKGHRSQYCDYSRLVRKENGTVPTKRLKVIFDHYRTASGDSGDLFTVNSYTKDRYTHDIPFVSETDRASDILDFRPRVKHFTRTDKSPFDWTTREFEDTFDYAVSPKEASIIGYSYYLPRIDKVTINRLGQVEVIKGASAADPKPPEVHDDAMEIAQISYPSYLFNPVVEPRIILRDNRRYTMRDIGKLEKRIKNLELTTTLSMLELDTKSLQVTDANGLSRFKTGFIVDNFGNRDFINPADSKCEVDVTKKELIQCVDNVSLPAELAFDPSIDTSVEDLSANLKLLDPNIQKTGDILTLKYEEKEWINQPQATQVENVNPFNVVVFVGGVQLDPASDNWVRTIYIDDHRTESTGAEWVQTTNTEVINVTESTDQNTVWHSSTTGTQTTTDTTNTTFRSTFSNSIDALREFDYVESIKISGESDPFMRSRNVYFAANGLKPYTTHYHYLDSQQLDIFPRLIEIEMDSGTFTVGEHVRVYYQGEWIGYVNAQKPNWKFGDQTSPAIAAGLGSPSTLVEKYTVDPYDRSRPAPSDSYSPTSRLFNAGVRNLAHAKDGYFGYCVKGATLQGMSSGATATVTRCELIADNWGDILGAFWIRDPNTTPKPPTLVRSGAKTFKITAVPPGVTPLPGSATFGSTAQGSYSGHGSILTQDTDTVSVRNPPPPADRPDEVWTETDIDRRVQTVYRDPLAQSFTTPKGGVFLTSVDVYFASKDPSAKIFFEVREVELGTPTNFLVQDFAEVALNPNDIQTSTDASVATNIKLPSPLYLEGEKEYAIVFLAPSSDLYEMWCATMGQKTVKTANLPDVQNVVVSKQYIGGSLFKSQNGTIWTPSQYQDLTFTLYNAEFVQSGSLTFYNTPILPRDVQSHGLIDNPIKALPRKVKVEIADADGRADDLAPGTRVSDGAITDEDQDSITGVVERVGAAIVGNPDVTVGGSGYDTSTNGVALYNITGNGSNAQGNVTVSGGKVTGVTITNAGKGYSVGDQLGVTTAGMTPKQGSDAVLTITNINNKIDTLYVTDVQGEKFTNTAQLITYNNSGARQTLQSTASGNPILTISSDSTVLSDLNTGNVFEVTQYNHAHHGANNKIKIEGVQPDREGSQSTAACGVNDTSVSVASTTPFSTFEGISTSIGYAQLNNEIVHYTVGTNLLTLNTRGVHGSAKIPHASGSVIVPYEANGFSLTGINSTHTLPSSGVLRGATTMDKYYLEAPRTGTRTNGKVQVSFAGERSFGGKSIIGGAPGGLGISQNHQFSSLEPKFNIITPGKGTSVSANIRTISGTSAGGNEVSFIDQGYEPVSLNKVIHFSTPRMVASQLNEAEQSTLSNLPKNKSLSLRVDFKSSDTNLSPVMDIQNAWFVLSRNKINNPIDDYAIDDRVNKLTGDPHGSIFVSNRVNLKQPATSLQVYIGANRPAAADFRVLYKLFKADSSEIPQSYVLFPGYSNLADDDGDGFGDRVIDASKNDGSADSQVIANVSGEYSEYQFTADNLDQFDGFVIKIVMSSTNESEPVKFKDFRALALA